VINEQTDQMSAVIGEDDGAFVIVGRASPRDPPSFGFRRGCNRYGVSDGARIGQGALTEPSVLP